MKLLIFFKTKKLLLINILLTFYIVTNLVGGERGLISYFEKKELTPHCFIDNEVIYKYQQQ